MHCRDSDTVYQGTFCLACVDIVPRTNERVPFRADVIPACVLSIYIKQATCLALGFLLYKTGLERRGRV